MNKTSCETQQFLDALLGYHCFTGCDTTSCFVGRGKVKPLQIMASNAKYIECFATLGSTEHVSQNTFDQLEDFVCDMYAKKNMNHMRRTVDELRYIIYCQKGGKVSYDLLPPCRNVLYQHIRRCNHQTYVWRKCFEPCIDTDCINNRWYLDGEGNLDILWMTSNPAPDDVLELISCSCKNCEKSCPCADIFMHGRLSM